jgi:hypothetical protein
LIAEMLAQFASRNEGVGMTRMILVGLAALLVGEALQPKVAQSPVVPCASVTCESINAAIQRIWDETTEAAHQAPTSKAQLPDGTKLWSDGAKNRAGTVGVIGAARREDSIACGVADRLSNTLQDAVRNARFK